MDYGFFNWVMKVKEYGGFSRKELAWVAVSVVIMTGIVGFQDGQSEFDVVFFVNNLLLGFVAIVVAVVIHEFAHRIAALNLGYRAEFRPFYPGLLGGIVVTLLTYGNVFFLAYSSFYLNVVEKHRLGYFRHYLGYFDNGKVAVVGPVANLLAAMVFKAMVFLPDALVSKLVFINVLFAITNMLPIPPLDGAHVMYATRTFYPFIMAFVIGAAALLLVPPVAWWVAVLGAFVIGLAWTLFYFNVIEGKWFGSW